MNEEKRIERVKRLLVHLTEEEHEWLRRKSFETNIPMAEILRQSGLSFYRKENQQED